MSAEADAWDAGYRAAIEDYGCDVPWGGFTSDRNPYREAQPDEPGPYPSSALPSDGA